MSPSDDAQRRLEDLLRAAAAADAAALQFRQAAESLQAGHPLLSAAEHRLAQNLLRPWLPAPPEVELAPPPGPWASSVEALRVIDTSVFPFITAGNTQAPTMALAWLAAERILGG